MSDLSIQFEETGSKGRYFTPRGVNGEQAEITFSRVSPQRIIVDHTGVPDSMRGQGVGVKLAEYVVADARSKGEKIIPLCPFFKAQAQRHEEWLDVVEL
ncbi:GNAT family N-acetyltransferase [Qipengyuania psychrotolerans]|uniref:N-acetyltransferase n=1 Tax=Qipengyuania psychrotolerans TaxID=2867238 RepID=A0ABX8ZDD1_9SPHN|nr:GNAT family N-acetyltransferase [Qipengyuania psychrotolerans]QZD87010.1 N-acetyltransferase [Qipengyuania psychrotolerans]